MYAEVYNMVGSKLTLYETDVMDTFKITFTNQDVATAILKSESYFKGQLNGKGYTANGDYWLSFKKISGSMNTDLFAMFDMDAEEVVFDAEQRRTTATFRINPNKSTSNTGSGGSGGGNGINWSKVGEVLVGIGKEVLKEIDLKDIIGGGGSGSGGGTGNGSGGAPDGGWGSGTGSGGGVGTISSVETYQNKTVINTREGRTITVEEPGEKLPTTTIVAGVALLALMGYIAFR